MVVIPCLNEAGHIGALLEQLRAPAERLDMAVIVVDGGSTDGTPEIVEAVVASNPAVVLLRNPKRIQSAAINLAVATYGNYFERLHPHRRAWRLSRGLLRPADRGGRRHGCRFGRRLDGHQRRRRFSRKPPPPRRIRSSAMAARRIARAPRAVGPIMAIMR